MNPHPPGLAVSLSHGAVVPILKHSSLGSTAPGCLPSSGCSWPCPGGLLLTACGASPHPHPPGGVLAPPRLTPSPARLTPGPAPPASPCTVRFGSTPTPSLLPRWDPSHRGHPTLHGRRLRPCVSWKEGDPAPNARSKSHTGDRPLWGRPGTHSGWHGEGALC